jgi:hypothetical protein
MPSELPTGFGDLALLVYAEAPWGYDSLQPHALQLLSLGH